MSFRVGASSGSVGTYTMLHGQASSLMSGYQVITILARQAGTSAATRVAEHSSPLA